LTGGNTSINVNGVNTSYVNVIASVVVNGEVFSYINRYDIKYVYQGAFSLKTALEDIANFDQGGFDNFGKGLFLVIVTLLIIGSAVKFSPNVINEPTSVSLLITLILAMWTISGFFNSLGSIGAWTPVVIFALISAGFLYRSVNER
jgi:hypothetical protein